MANVVPIPGKRAERAPRPKLVPQFLVVLAGTNPLTWRPIQVPETFSFWDLHVAIQDAMGWLDYHLHEFRLLDAKEQAVVSIGTPTDDDPEDRPVVPGWQVPLSKFFDQRRWHALPAIYAYDFGDDWQHVLLHEGFESATTTGPTLAVSPVKAGVRLRTVAVPTDMRSCSTVLTTGSGEFESSAVSHSPVSLPLTNRSNGLTYVGVRLPRSRRSSIVAS